MMKVTIQEKFNTSMGLIMKVKNDRVFKVGDNIETDEGEFKIKRIIFPKNPNELDFINIMVYLNDPPKMVHRSTEVENRRNLL